MSKNRGGLLYLEDVRDCMNKINKYVNGMSFEDFDQNQLVIDAVARNLEVIGEATKYVPTEIREKYPEVPWKSMIGLRNILIHEYFGIDEQIIWQIITSDFKKTKPLIEKIIEDYR
jgi:uncharacterized protein with HEPN domain